MRIAFLDFGDTEYDPSTVDTTPLGGTESAVCYLSRSLARRGHEIFLLGKAPVVGTREGVMCIPRDRAPIPSSLNLDAMVCVGAPSDPAKLRSMLGPSTRLVRWVHLAPGQPSVDTLKDPAEQRAYDAIVMVSNWQRDQFYLRFGVDPARTVVLKNGIGFPFERQFAPDEPILAAKQWPPVLCYCSAPYRGLDVLLEAFPAIRAAVPGARLRVYSSLTLYGFSPEKDDATFGQLYKRCRETDGVDYIGAVSQPELAPQMRDVSLLTYPNMMAESFCIVAVEAMASGCRVITTHHGALSETTAGFARLIPLRPTLQEYLKDFIAQTIEALHEQSSNPSATESFLRRQVDFIKQTGAWDVRAKEWTTWLSSLPRHSRGA
jgi:glycosyltransferase involved in cell wall biosynthesis